MVQSALWCRAKSRDSTPKKSQTKSIDVQIKKVSLHKYREMRTCQKIRL
jgi:hypothetical protein